jgi:uncharacterized protein (DUF1330 family)
MPNAYVIVDVTVTNADQMVKYREWSSKAASEFNATFLVRGGAITVLEGDWNPSRVVVLQFESTAQAKAWYAGETYTHARQLRENAGVLRIVLVEGI